MAVDLAALLADLDAESRDLDGILARLDAAAWTTSTPAEGWTVTDQVSHLAYFDETATLALVDPERFRRDTADLLALGADFPDHIAARFRDLPPVELLHWWRSARAALLEAFATADPTTRLPWYGPDMGAASSLTARLMETWAHGQDVADAVGVRRTPTARLRHVADLGVRTFGFSHRLHGRPVPENPVRVELLAPDGATTWTWGPDDAADRVTGAALDFCLVVVQRRHVADTALEVTGPVATGWIEVAQAFAGAPSTGRPPLSATGGAR